MRDNWYFTTGGVLGSLGSICAFFGSWFYCISHYGYLLGFGLGWLPSSILAGIVFWATYWLWGLAAVGAVVSAAALAFTSRPATPAYYPEAVPAAGDATAPAADLVANSASAPLLNPVSSYEATPAAGDATVPVSETNAVTSYVAPVPVAPSGGSSGGTGYEDIGAPYGCTHNCSGHNAGYEWAENNGVSTADDCSGNSQSFIEGCQAYTESQSSSSSGETAGEETASEESTE